MKKRSSRHDRRADAARRDATVAARPLAKVDPRLAMLLRLPKKAIAEARKEAAQHPDVGNRLERAPKFSSMLYAHLRFGDANDALRPAHGKPDVPWVSILLKFDGDGAVVRARLAKRGFQVRSLAGDILTALAPLDAIEPVRREEHAVRFIELGRFARRQMDRTIPEIGAAALRGGHPSFTGAGVVIGVIDIDGLDFYHPDLRREDGTTRITHLWDQQLPDKTGQRVPAPWGYGSEHLAADIDADFEGATPYAVVAHVPDVPDGLPNHATHTTGIAAGNGRASKVEALDRWGTYTGVAPEASIIYVNTFASGTRGLADLAEICDAIAYIFDRAGDAPSVVNISLGDDLGPHDGTSLVEQFIDIKLAEAPGRAVVIAAGNGNRTQQHAEVVVPSSGWAKLELQVGEATTDSEAIQIWYRGDDRLAFAIREPGGNQTAFIKPGAPVAVKTLGGATLTIASTIHDGRDGDNVIEMVMEPHGKDEIRKGPWMITLSRPAGSAAPVGESRCHAWVDGNTEVRADMRLISFAVAATTPGHGTLTTPATCRKAITVGNYTANGGDVADGSSRGPTRDGRQKPELAAPGSANPPPDLTGIGITAPAARARAAGTTLVGEYLAGAGTSQAAAHVSGLTALLFQMHGGARLTIDETRGALLSAARKGNLSEVPDPDQAIGWGFAHLGPTTDEQDT